MHVSRDTDGRLNGELVSEGDATSHGFCGTLELLKALEDLVVPASPAGTEKGPPAPGSP
jgi:hypothetical protein